MGQAKSRGTKEERIAQAVERERIESQARAEERKRRKEYMRRPSSGLALAAVVGLAMSVFEQSKLK